MREYLQEAARWDGDERRREQNMLFDLLAQQNQKLDDLTEVVRKTASELSALASGFPDDDPAGHRRYHEAEIKRIERRADFWAKLRLELAKWGLIGFVAWAAVALWQQALRGPQ